MVCRPFTTTSMSILLDHGGESPCAALFHRTAHHNRGPNWTAQNRRERWQVPRPTPIVARRADTPTTELAFRLSACSAAACCAPAAAAHLPVREGAGLASRYA